MMNKSKQEINAGSDSTIYQAKEMHIHGPNTESIIEISKLTAQNVFNDNFLKLRGEAYEVAYDRANEFLNDYLNKLKEKSVNIFENLKSPSIQASLYEAQQQYAKSGDADLERMLINLLVERTKITGKSIHQIVLDESISVVSKMNQEQIDAITLNFALQEVSAPSISLKYFCDYFSQIIFLFLPENYSTAMNSTSLQYLEYTGSVRFSETSVLTNLGNLFLRFYPHLFCKGFDNEEFNRQFSDLLAHKDDLTEQCIHNCEKLQFKAKNRRELTVKLQRLESDGRKANELLGLFDKSLMSNVDVFSYLSVNIKRFEDLASFCKIKQVSTMKFTPVGTAIALTNFNLKTGNSLPMEVWIPK